MKGPEGPGHVLHGNWEGVEKVMICVCVLFCLEPVLNGNWVALLMLRLSIFGIFLSKYHEVLFYIVKHI